MISFCLRYAGALLLCSAGLSAQLVFVSEQHAPNSTNDGSKAPVWAWNGASFVNAGTYLHGVEMNTTSRGIASFRTPGNQIYVVSVRSSSFGNPALYISEYVGGGIVQVGSVTFPAEFTFGQIVLSPDCKTVYMLSWQGKAVWPVDITNLASPVVGTPITLPASSAPKFMDIRPQGDRLLVMDPGGTLYDIQLQTNTITTVALGLTHSQPRLRISPDGKFAYFGLEDTARSFAVIDLASYPASLASVQPGPGGNFGMFDLVFHPTLPKAYFLSWPAGVTASTDLYVVDTTTHTGSLVSVFPSALASSVIAIEPDGSAVWVGGVRNDTLLFRVPLDASGTPQPADPAILIHNGINVLTGNLGQTPGLTSILNELSIPRTCGARLTAKANIPGVEPVVALDSLTPANTNTIYADEGSQHALDVPNVIQPVGFTTAGPRYVFLNEWVLEPNKCGTGNPFATTPNALTNPALAGGYDTYCACFEKQWYVTVNVTGSCTAALNGTNVASGSGIWVKEGTTVTGTATPSTGATVSAPVTANAAGQSIDIVCGSSTSGGTGNCTPPPQGLTAWYPFDEITGPAVSQITSAPNLNWVGSPSPATGKVAGAIALNGTQYLQAATTTAFDPGANSFSVDFWMRSSTPNTVLMQKMCGGVFGGTGCQPSTFQGWQVNLNPAGRLSFNIGTISPVTTNGLISSPTMPVLTDGNWHFVGIVFDRGTGNITVYIDGTAPSKTFTLPMGAPAGSLITASLPFRVGADALAGPGMFNGSMDELEIFEGIAPAATFQAIYDADSNGKCKNAGPCATASSLSSLRGWWSFEGNDPILNDKRGVNNFLLPRNATRTTGYVGQALQFGIVALNSNNSASTTDAAPEINFTSESFTIDAWIKYQSGVNGFRSIVDKFGGDVNGGGGYSFFMDNGALMLSITPANSTSANARVWSSNSVNVADNNWHHVAVVVDRTKNGPDFYVDGVLRSLTSSSGPMFGSSISLSSIMPLNVGGFNFAGSETRGLIDELQIFGEAVPASVIKEIYDAKTTGKCPRDDKGCVLAPFGMVSWYPFTPVTGQTYFNDHATTNSTLVPVGVVPPVSSQVGTGVSMIHNTIGYLQTTASFPEHNFGTAPFSLDFWVRAGQANQIRYVAEKMAYAGSSPLQGWSVRIVNGKLVLLVADGTGSTATYTSSLNAITTGPVRRHIAITANRLGAPQMYFDGLPDTGITASGSPTVMQGNLNNTSLLRVGASTVSTIPPADAIEMELDELQIFTRALFAGEVYAIFASPQGKCAQTPGPPVITIPTPTNFTVTVNLAGCLTGTSFTSNPAASGNVITVAQGGTVTITFTGSVGSVVASPGGPIPLTGNIATITNVQANTVITVTCIQTTLCYPINMTGMVAWYPLNETGTGVGIAHSDIAGVNDTLTRQGNVQPVTGMVNGAQLFTNGATAATAAASAELDFGSGDFSADAWINPQSPSGVIMSKLSVQPGWYINLRSSSGPSELEFGIVVPGFVFQWATIGAAIPLNTWTHIAVVARRNAPPEFYINGTLFSNVVILAGGSSSVPPVNVNTNAPFRLSGTTIVAAAALPGFSGALDEVELFNRSLMASEILGIFQAGPMGKCPPANTSVNITVNTNPANIGVTVGVNGQTSLNTVTVPVPASSAQTVTAAPASTLANGILYNFINWTPSGPNVSAPSSGSATYTANYNAAGYVVTATGCGISVGPASLAMQQNPLVFPANATLTVTANPNATQTFQNIQVTIGSNTTTLTTNPATVTLTGPATITGNCLSSQVVNGTFNTQPVALLMRVGSTGDFSLAPIIRQVNSGQELQVATQPQQTKDGAGYQFVNWSNGAATPTTSITPTAAVTLTANFRVACYVVTASVNPFTGGSIAASARGLTGFPDGCYAPGTVLTFAVTPATGQAVTSWTGVTATGNTATLTVNAPATIVANMGTPAAPALAFEYVGRSGLTINMRARNTGNASASSLRITALSVQNTGELSRYAPATTLPLTIGDIAPGGSVNFALSFTASGGAAPNGGFSFSMTAASATTTAATIVVQVPAVTGSPVLTLDAVSRVNSGANATLTFRITNTGTATATNIVAMVAVQATTASLTINAPSTSVPDIVAGDFRDVTFVVSAPPGASIAAGTFNAQLFVNSDAPSVTKAWNFAAPTTINPL